MRLACAALLIGIATPALAELKPAPPAAELVSINTHEHFKLRPDAHGKFGKKELHGWTRFMRCWHTGRQHAMAPRLAELIYTTAQHFEFKLIRLFDGYRAPRVARAKGNTKSPHKKGIAADFVIEGVDNKVLRDYLFTQFERVGVGYYPNSSFVHLDVRPGKGKAFWTDYSFPNQRQSKQFYSKQSWEQIKAGEEAMDALHKEGEEGGEEPPKNAGPGAVAPTASDLGPAKP